MNKHLLMILDGYGIAEDPSVSAIDFAHKPFLDQLFAEYPHSTLDASGLAVGLPEGQMGNSEVGHMNLGAGRVVYQEMTRIDEAIRDRSFFENDVLVEAMKMAIQRKAKVHVLGLLSDGGVHSNQNHLDALLELGAAKGLTADNVLVHAFMDGRDTSPTGGKQYLARLEAEMARVGCGRVASIIGRYWAMDRDHRWPRIQKAYDLLVEGKGKRFATAEMAIKASYEANVTDEFVEPCVIGGGGVIHDHDVIIFINYRADRARQISHALLDNGFLGFSRRQLDNLYFVAFTPYESSFSFPVAYPKENLTHTLGEVIAARGFKQLRAAETEKYPHVTYFFNGGKETPFEGEDRILVPSPKVATYDLQPEMSAPELAVQVAQAIQQTEYALVVINFANPDMVGHTGVLEAAIKAVEAVDKAAQVVVNAALKAGYSVNIIADHGNSDRMKNPDGSPHTAHTTVRVPHLIIKNGFKGPIQHGRLGDVAPTILDILGLEQPSQMKGHSLISP
ncbi:MAG: 2,3-bisphosphoglycerate-independent phosphoglycerate mutase [Bacteroidetes bacterium]|nr:2,3-bisphosphoglycerate-independent phosphoglycerate mutase [Bacteroidota bacterium]